MRLFPRATRKVAEVMDIKAGGVEGGLKSGKSNELLQRERGQQQQQQQQQQQDKERLQVEIHHGSK